MTDVLAFIGLALAVPVAYLLGYQGAKKALAQTTRDVAAMRRHGEWTRIPLTHPSTRIFPPHHNNESERDEMDAVGQLRAERDAG